MTSAAEAIPAGQNHLAGEASPYLRSHAANPVDWFPWGDEAFAKATREDKPIFLSIGYATCHWCHVMAHESFENAEIASFLNQHFVCIKVDREERPDVDQLYITFVEATTGGAGWPLSVWLTPARAPFAGGTYFPPDQFLANLKRVAERWHEHRDDLLARGGEATAFFATQAAPTSGATPSTTETEDDRLFSAAIAAFSATFDAENGGFGGAPKFPRPVTLDFLARMAERFPAERARLHGMCLRTWRALIDGGIHDHLGGGFHRYSVDAAWRVPHFEKMLYDQAQVIDGLIDVTRYAEASDYRAVAAETCAYVLRDLRAVDGGFIAAEDADSARADAATEPAEGAFYVWSAAEIRAQLTHALGAEGVVAAELFAYRFGVEPDGNVAAALDARGELRGANVLALRHDLGDTARHAGLATAAVEALLTRSRAALFAARAARPRPPRDDQTVVAWNGLMIGALAHAASTLGREDLLAAATAAAELLKRTAYRDEVGLARTAFSGERFVYGAASDYAFLIHGLIALYEVSGEARWLAWAVAVQDHFDRRFWDEASAQYFLADERARDLVARLRDDDDGAEPAANSIACLNLTRLAAITDDAALRARAGRMLAAVRMRLGEHPNAYPAMLAALDEFGGPAARLLIIGTPGEAGTRALIATAHARYRPWLRVVTIGGEAEWSDLSARFPGLVAMPALGGKATAYLCSGRVCKAPTADPTMLARWLDEGARR